MLTSPPPRSLFWSKTTLANIHSKASLYEAFPAAEARRLIERFEWRYTPKHGSWLNPEATIEQMTIEQILITRPRPSAIMPRTTYLLSGIGESVLRRIRASILASGIVASRASVPRLALLT